MNGGGNILEEIQAGAALGTAGEAGLNVFCKGDTLGWGVVTTRAFCQENDLVAG